jgi:sigma-B regulation protein RsbU (phosphoserine phosphatase)
MLVRGLQQSLLPPVVPTVEGLQVAAVYRPAGIGDEVGGDFYAVFQLAEDDWIVVVGDVTGKGVEAAAVSAIARYTIRAAAVVTPQPATILSTLNHVLRTDELANRWCTVVVARMIRLSAGWSVEICHGGHPIALVVEHDGVVRDFGVPGTLLGHTDAPRFRPQIGQLREGDALVLDTDGVTEARRRGEQFGEGGLRAALDRHRGAANGLVYGVIDEVLAFGSARTSDDVVIVAVQA